MSTFITNQPTKKLNKRLQELILSSKELKFLTAFFYFSGLKEIYESLKKNKYVQLKILVGLNIDKTNKGLIEYSDNKTKEKSINEKITDYFYSLKKILTSNELDKKETYEQIKFFLKLIKNNRLQIKKTLYPNHAKLYIFLTKGKVATIIEKILITGSSNLTKAGLLGQEEFNIELGGKIVNEAEEYFDNLWEKSIPITENDKIKSRLLKIIEEETFIREISPFQAFILLLKSYLESYKYKNLTSRLFKILEKNGYKKFTYQIDAIRQALSIIEDKNGVILADVVGLGKTIMACAIAKELGQPGIIISPPGLKGDSKDTEKGGWNMYKRQFELYDWEVWSSGELKKLHKEIKNRPEVKVIIIDEAHRFRNEDTQSYEYLKNICRGKKVILLTATPFNNKPSDILSLIKLFLPPKKSTITLDDNLSAKFATFKNKLKKINFILKYHNSSGKKRKRALDYYKNLFNETTINLKKVKGLANYISREIRSVIEPITIRRNRIDLIKNPRYKNEIEELSQVEDPKEWFYELTKEQSEFYDKVIKKYFADPEDGGEFKGAIYRPFIYEKGLYGKYYEEEQLKQEENRAIFQQNNLYDFMRRLLVKRFESSFGAFRQSIINFKEVTKAALDFIQKHQIFILDRNLVMKLTEMDEDQIQEELEKYKEKLQENKRPKHDKIYKLQNFKQKELFLKHIKSDLNLFSTILEELEKLKLIQNDPKAQTLLTKLKKELKKSPAKGEPKRKIVIFSEYTDTVKYLGNYLKQHLNRILVIDKNLSKKFLDEILENFDASHKNQKDKYDILLTSDKLSEGFNLNRAGMVINYDIPWNPVRVIQRVGRINRINKKVFNKLYIINFFPTEKGSKLVKSREIASQKMFLIHKILGEDTKIFEPDEEPQASTLYSKLMQNPEKTAEETFYTKAYNYYQKIKQKYPNIEKEIKNLPPRIKVAKKSNQNELLVFIKKNKQIYVRQVDYNNDQINDTTFEMVFNRIVCDPQEKPIDWNSDKFWQAYEKALTYKTRFTIATSEQSIERKALNVIETLLNQVLNLDHELLNFLKNIKEDILYYGSLSKMTLRTIANLPISDQSKLKKYLYKLADDLGGINYLENEKKALKKIKKEIIVAIENKKIT